MKEKSLSLLKQIEETCQVLLEDRQLRENRLIAARLGLQQILTLRGWAIKEIEKDSPRDSVRSGHLWRSYPVPFPRPSSGRGSNRQSPLMKFSKTYNIGSRSYSILIIIFCLGGPSFPADNRRYKRSPPTYRQNKFFSQCL